MGSKAIHVTKKGVKVAIYSQPTRANKNESYVIAYYVPGLGRRRDRVTGTFANAQQAAEKKALEIASGTAQVHNFTPTETAAIGHVLQLCDSIGTSLPEAVSEYCEAVKICGMANLKSAAEMFHANAVKRALTPRTFAEVGDEFLKTIEDRSFQYNRTMKGRLKMANKAFGSLQISKIGHAEFQTWLDQFKFKNKKNYRDVLITVSKFARRKNYLSSVDETEAQKTETPANKAGDEITFILPRQYAILLNSVSNKFLPLVAFGGFAGLRSAEISRLDWSDIKFDRSNILIRAKNAKTKSRRNVPMCEALKAWLLPLKKDSGPVMPFMHDQAMLAHWNVEKRAIAKNTGVVIGRNMLRHSYGTYQMELLKNEHTVSGYMGNSPQMLYSNYRELTDETLASEYFAIMPPPNKITLTTDNEVPAS